MRYFDPKNDFAFKKLFHEKDLLICFLNSMLRLKGEREIQDLQYLLEDEAPALPMDKRCVVDVRCQDHAGHQFIVEIQNQTIPEFAQRIQYYSDKSYMDHLSRGQEYAVLKPVILLVIVNETLFAAKDDYLHYHSMLDTKTLENDLKDLSVAFVELSKFKKSAEECKSLEDQWFYFFKYAMKENDPPFQEKHLLRAYNVMEQCRWTPYEQNEYIKVKLHMESGALAQEKKYKEGIEEGKKEGKRQRIIEAMRAQGLSEDVIQKVVEAQG